MARESGGRMILGIAARLSLSVLLHRLSRIATPATPQRKLAERATIGPFHEKPPAPWAAPTQIRRTSESRERDGSPSLELRTIAAASRRSRSCTRQFGGTSRRSWRRSNTMGAVCPASSWPSSSDTCGAAFSPTDSLACAASTAATSCFKGSR